MEKQADVRECHKKKNCQKNVPNKNSFLAMARQQKVLICVLPP